MGIIPVYAQTLINGKLVIDNYTIYDRPNSSIFMAKVTMTNQGTQPFSINSGEFFLWDSNNIRYSITDSSKYLTESDSNFIANNCLFVLFNLNPNVPNKINICFEIPKGKQDFTTLEFFDNSYPLCNTIGCYLMTDVKTNNPISIPQITNVNSTPVNSTTAQTTTPSKLPSWVRSDFKLYGDGQISEDELLNAIKYLLQQGIIKLS